MNMPLKTAWMAAAILCGTLRLKAQEIDQLRFTKAEELTFASRIMPTKNPYHRADTTVFKGLPPYVNKLLTYGSGMAIAFTTNSTVIGAKWCTSKTKAYNYLTPVTNKGLDLYIKKNGKWQFAGVGKPTETCSDAVLVKDMDEGEKECLLYLPLYDEIGHLEIGVENKAKIAAMPDPFQNRILIYGSSIVNGASASRPGMAYPARLSRATGLNFLNLGLSGSAKMEKEAADLVAAVDADAYVLDCVPNSSPQIIKQRTQAFVARIRERHPDAPIIVMQTIIREQGYWDNKMGKMVKDQNVNIQNEVLAMVEKGVKNLYFITTENMLGDDHEGSIDGTHPNDLGFTRMVESLKPQLLGILARHGIVPPAPQTELKTAKK